MLQFGKVKIVPVDAMKAYKGSGCLGSLILNPQYQKEVSGQLQGLGALLLGKKKGNHEQEKGWYLEPAWTSWRRETSLSPCFNLDRTQYTDSAITAHQDIKNY